LTANYPTRECLSIWNSLEVGYPVGRFNPTREPLRKLAPSTYECDVYGGRPVLDSAAIVLKILSRLPNATALISTFWQSLMLGDLGLHTDHNRLSNDLDVAITSPRCHSLMFCSILRISRHLVKQRNKFPPYDMFSTSNVLSHWPEIPPTVQVNYTLPYRHGEPVPRRPMLEIHPLTTDVDHAQTLEKFLRCYAPFCIRSQGLNIIAVSAQTSDRSGQYYPFEEYPPGYNVAETIVRIFSPDSGNHTIALTAHHEPTPRLGIIVPRIALAAVIGSIGKREPITIDDQTITLTRESLRMLTASERRRVDKKTDSSISKVALVQRHLNMAAGELASPVYRDMRGPRIPFPKSNSPLRDAFINYLRILGY